jgi:hypothetical protein
MIYKGQVISYDLAPPPLPYPPFPSVSTRPATQRKTEKEIQLTEESGGEGVGEEPIQTTTRKPGPLFIIQYSLPPTCHPTDPPSIHVKHLMTTSLFIILLGCFLRMLFYPPTRIR